MSDPKDRFQRLRTWEAATPGPWRHVSVDDWDFVGHSDDDHPMGAIPRSADDARHIATWDPETAREVVELLEMIDAWRARPALWDPDKLHRRLDALLDRIGGGQ